MNTQWSRITELLHECGQLRHLPRSGYAFLGSGQESVADHSYRTAMIAWVLARLSGADAAKAVFMALIHDLGEARVGDQNYVNRAYVNTRERDAVCDAVKGTGLADEMIALWDEQEARTTPESTLVRDADQLDLLLNLKRELDLGNPQAAVWMDGVEKRLTTEAGRTLSVFIRAGQHSDWWLPDVARAEANKHGAEANKHGANAQNGGAQAQSHTKAQSHSADEHTHTREEHKHSTK